MLGKNDPLKVVIVGAGIIAQEYAKVLSHLGIGHVMVCRNIEKAQKLINMGHMAHAGGIEDFLAHNQEKYDIAINATDIDNLFPINVILLKSKRFTKILTEKPGALNQEQFNELLIASQESKTKLFIAYNRRMHSSTLKLQKILENEKCTSIHFEFTEWFWKIDPDKYSKSTISNWLLCNSSHLIDLAFHLGSGVKQINSSTKRTRIHDTNNSQFVGHGLFNNGALFSYSADWESAGRWKIEVCTSEGKYLLCPLEKLFFQKKGNLEYENILIDDEADRNFKPGFLYQTRSMLEDEPNLKTIKEQTEDFTHFQKINNSPI